MPKRVIAISLASGAGGEPIGRIVSRRLGFRYVDQEIISTAAAKLDLDPNLVADAEKRKGLVTRFVGGLARAAVDIGSTGYAIPTTPDLEGSDDFRRLILEAITETADQGDVVIVAHAASVLLAGRDDVLRVFITASQGKRADRLAGTGLNDQADPAKTIKQNDAARADYLRRFHAIDRELPTHYDLVINTDHLGFDQAAEIVVLAAGL